MRALRLEKIGNPGRRFGRWPMILAMAGLALFAISDLTLPALAQPDQRTLDLGLYVFREKATCQFCHGWHGGGETSQYGGRAPSLRATPLDRDQLIEIVACGIPGAGMPYHDRNAYRDDRCYGLTSEELGDDMPPRGLAMLPQREIEAVVDYVIATYQGRPAEPTLDECIAFWGQETRQCDAYQP